MYGLSVVLASGDFAQRGVRTMRKKLIDLLCWLGVFLCCGLLAAALAYPAYAHDLPGIPAENQAWYQNAETNPGSTPRTVHGWQKCCNHAEVVDAKYIIRPDGKDGWRWNDNGVLKDIPLDIIHWYDSAPDNKPTLFVYNGVMTCFYPPSGGV